MICFSLLLFSLLQTYDLISINSHEEQKKELNLSTKFSNQLYYEVLVYPNYQSFNIYFNLSNKLFSCEVFVEDIDTKKVVYFCGFHDHCSRCECVNATGLKQNKEYKIHINLKNRIHKIDEKYRWNVSTLHFWDYDFKLSNTSINVTIIDYSVFPITCNGTIKEKISLKTVFDCKNNPSCKSCKSFVAKSLVPGTDYILAINSSYSTMGFSHSFKTFYTFEVRMTPSYDMVHLFVLRTDSLKMTCTGTVKEKNTNKTVFDCNSDPNCKQCISFDVKNLQQKTLYIIDIKGNQPGVFFTADVNTTTFWDFEVKVNDNSMQLSIIKNSSIPIICTGHIWNLNDSILVFNCSNNYFCQSCQNFTVDGLYANTLYEITLNSTKPDLNQTVPYLNRYINLTTTYHIKPIFVQNYTSITILMNRSINLTAQCYGNVYEINTMTPVYTCEQNYYCRLCVNFTIFSLKENQLYVFDIHSEPKGVFPQNISTLNFWDVLTQSTLNSISVNITLHSNNSVQCSGYLYDPHHIVVFDCSHDQNCKVCHSFVINGLTPNVEYFLNITTNYSNIKFEDAIKTDRIFDVSTNISFFSMNVFVMKIKNLTAICSGDILLYGTNQSIFSCDKNDGCSSCENFTVYGMTENTRYKASIFVNGAIKFLNEIFTTKPLWTATFSTTAKSLSVSFVRFYTETLVCSGMITEVNTGNNVLNCSNNANCSTCNTFTIDGLKQDTEYMININSSINHTGVEKTVKTMKLLELNYTATFNKINISIKKDHHAQISCSGKAYNNETKEVVFNCTNNPNCRSCSDFEMTGLSSKTAYVVNLKTNVTGFDLSLLVGTDEYVLKVKEKMEYLTNISLDITPNYVGGGSCNLTLYDKLMNKTNITCSGVCPSDCDKLNFTIVNLDMNSDYTLSVTNKYINEMFSVSLYTSNINYTLYLEYMSETKFIVSAHTNTTGKIIGICNFTILHLQTGNMTDITNDCSNIEKDDIQKGECYKVSLISSLSTETIKPLIIYTLPIQPENIQFYQLNNTALDVKVKINITQPAPIDFRIKLYDDQHIIKMIDSHISYIDINHISISGFRDFEAIVSVVPYILIKVGTCTFINTSFCLTAKEEYCSSCVYTRIPIFYINFYFPGDVTLVSVEKYPTKLRIVLPPFNPDNKWTSRCSIFIAKVLHLDSLSKPLPDNFDMNYGVYYSNIWALLYRSGSLVTCETAANITFGDKTDKNQLHLDFVQQNLYYVGFLQLCRHSTCVSSKLSNIEYILSKSDLNTQFILYIIALILGSIILLMIIILLLLRNLRLISTETYKVESAAKKISTVG